MNIRKFKETVSTWENYEEKFSCLRKWIDACYDGYCKEKNLEFSELEREYQYEEQCYMDSEEYRNLIYQWNEIPYVDVNEIYRKMNWEIDDLKDIEHQLDIDIDILYYPILISDIYQKIEKIQDDIEYAYAFLLLANAIHESKKCSKNLKEKIYEGLVEFGLKDCLKLEEESHKVFIAMWFDDSMQKARKNIEKAVKECGYEPMLIDIKEHNNQIVPEIFKEIEESEFVIADLTGHRGGVYYEAGYAIAKGKQVILSCKEGERTHFDVAQINTIYWKEEQDLYERLKKRIKATVGAKR